MLNAKDILGLEGQISKKQIIQAYREKSTIYHPDKGGDADMMKIINQAKEELLQQLEDAGFVEASLEDLSQLLSQKVREPIDLPAARISTKYRVLYAEWLSKFSTEEVDPCLAYSHFKEFTNDLYIDVTTTDGATSVIKYKDLLDLLKQKTARTDCIGLEELNLPLTPQTAIAIFIKFVEGKCFGDKLVQARQLFKDGLAQISSTHAIYNLYTGMSEVLHLESIVPNEESRLLAALNKITNFIRQNPNAAMPYCASLLQNKYFRNLFSQALHLLWQECSNGVRGYETAFIDLNTTKSYLGVLAKKVLANEKANTEDLDLLKAASYINKLYQFETLVSERPKELTFDFCRERGFEILDWLTALIPYASRKVIVNILMQAGLYFQIASTGKVVSKKKADQKLALHAYMEAISLASNSAPDLEIYAINNCLKFIAAFNYRDASLSALINALQTRVLSLMDIFPVYISLQTNINLIRNNEQTLIVMRTLLHMLIEIIEQNKTAAQPIPIAYEQVKILYHAYEACVQCWYQEYYNPQLENEFRLELMQVLLKKHNWTFKNFDPYLSNNTIPRDTKGWASFTLPLRINDLPVQAFSSLEAMEIDNNTGQISFTVSEVAVKKGAKNHNTCSINDLIEMIFKNVTGGSFSLDPVDPEMMYHPFNTMRFVPKDLHQTQFLNAMLLTDYILKFLTTGQEVCGKYPYDFRPIQELIAHLPPRLKNIIDNLHATQQHSTGSIHRFWIEAKEISKAEIEKDGKYKVAICDVKMVVKKHAMRRDHDGNLQDTEQENEGWDLHILRDNQLMAFYQGRIIIEGPAMMFTENSCKVSFVINNKIYKQGTISIYQLEEMKNLSTYPRDTNGKVKITVDNEDLFYKLVSQIAKNNKEAIRFSPEYIFAQEFTEHYDEFSKYIPEFARLKELSRISAAINILHIKKLAAEHKAKNLQKLIAILPSWEERDLHPANSDDYFALVEDDSLTAEQREFATFKHHNIAFIKSMLPNNVYKQHIENLNEIVQQISGSEVYLDSPEVERHCKEIYQENERQITRQQGLASWFRNSERIWQEILAQKQDIVNKVNAARTKQFREQLHQQFSKKLRQTTQVDLNYFIDEIMQENVIPLAEALTKQDIIEIKVKLQKSIAECDKILQGFSAIGLGELSRKEDDISLEQECLWVPASVRHHVAGNNSQFVYGGVRIVPRVNVIASSNPNFTRIMNNAFTGPNRITINSAALNSVSGFAQQMAASTRAPTLAPTRAPTSVYQTASTAPVRTNSSNNFTPTRAATNSYQPASNSSAVRTPSNTNFSSARQTTAGASAGYRHPASNSNVLPRTQPTGSSFAASKGSSSFQTPANSSNARTTGTNLHFASRSTANSSASYQAQGSTFTAPRSQGSGSSRPSSFNSAGGNGGNPIGGGGSNNGSNNSYGGNRGSNNPDFRDGLKLRTELAFKESGLLDGSGKLTAKALECTKDPTNRLIEGCDLKNKAVIAALTKNGQSLENWAKYSTNTVTLGTGNVASIHFYYNENTGEVMYEHDFKVKGGFAAATNTTQHKNCDEYVDSGKYGGDDVTLFTNKKTLRKTGQEPVSQPDPCHRYDGSKKPHH